MKSDWWKWGTGWFRTPRRRAREVGWRCFVCAVCVYLETRNGRRDLTCGGSMSIVFNFPVLIRRSTPTKMRATLSCIQSTQLCDTVYFDNDDRLFWLSGYTVSPRMFLSSPRITAEIDTRPSVWKKCSFSLYPADHRSGKTSQ